MRIPKYFRNKIIRTFGDKGERWLLDLPEIFKMCKEKWRLEKG
ncbi:hypothetical protein [Thermohalobacter berrensis]|nr:hypothetical protein [Thermohalobacter berrensis]